MILKNLLKLNMEKTMTPQEFNEKYKKWLVPRFYGMAIEDERVINYLDEEFSKEIQINPGFTYMQIKLKFNSARIYATSPRVATWEKQINKILEEQC